MERILVEVFLPSSNTSYDIFISPESVLSEVLSLISSALSSLAQGEFRASNDTILCDADSGKIFDINTSVAELGIKNGSRLMLI
ncbi:MAG: methyltransferase [Clostridium sp.]|nr:methyltransferase [Clostridium sp.]